MVAEGIGHQDETPNIISLCFNQDQTCLAVGTLSGFRLFTTSSFTLLHQEECGPVSVIEMLFSTSLLALVGLSSPQAPSSSDKKLTMWNTKNRCSLCQLQFSAKVYNVKMNHRRVVVLLQQKIHIFDLKTMKSLHVIDRIASPWADPSLGWLCSASERGLLATPLALAGASPVIGSAPSSTWASGGLQHEVGSGAMPDDNLGLVSVLDTYTLQPIGTVLAHRCPVQAICLNPTGQILATASTKGTVIRLFAVPTLEIVASFRRGTNVCRIFSLLFSSDSSNICASAASGTVHIFRNSESVCAGISSSLEVGSQKTTSRETATEEPIMLGPRTQVSPATPTLSPESPDVLEDFELDKDILGSDWNIVDESPDRQLEHSINGLEGGGSSRQNAMQTLAAAKGFAVVNTARYAEIAMKNSKELGKTLLNMLPGRNLVDAPRAFAWVRLRGEESDDLPNRNAPPMSREVSTSTTAVLASKTAAVAGNVGAGLVQGLSNLSTEHLPKHCYYVACVCLKFRDASAPTCRPQVLVATIQGCAHVYDWDAAAGGECRLRTEYSLIRGPIEALKDVESVIFPQPTKASAALDEESARRQEHTASPVYHGA